MERESPTPWLPFSRLLNFFGPLPDISLATWDLAPLSQHHWIRDMKMKIYQYLSDRREIYETVVKCVETCNLQKVWDSSDSLNGNSCFAMINLYSICNSNDQQRIFKTTGCNHRGKGERNEVKKEQIWPISYLWIRSLNLRRNHLHTNLQVKARLYVNFNALRKYDFLDTFFLFFFAVTILNITL